MSDTTLFFVMDGPNFEPGAILLSVSLRKQMGQDITIEACVPTPRIDEISPMARDTLAACGVTIRSFEAKADWVQPYPHGNKILASCMDRGGNAAVFFDTDMVAIAPLDFSGIGDAHTLMAVPEGVPTWSRHDADWAPLYEAFGLDLPTERVRLARGRRITMLPYFNGGLVGFSLAKGPEGLTFAECWLDTALRIDRMDIDRRRPWLDQISLPIAAARMGARLDVRDPDYNFSLHRREVREDIDMRLLHYHIPGLYRKWPQCRAVTENALRLAPAQHRDELRERLRAFIEKRSGKTAAA
jgi:hypothetical protein